MSEIPPGLEQLPRNELYFHNVDAGGNPEELKRVAESLSQGNPLFCLEGRGTLKKGESNLNKTTDCLIFYIPNEDINEVITQIHPSKFEAFSAREFPLYYTFVQPVSKEFKDEAWQWILKQRKHKYRRESYLSATTDDVRMLPSKYFLGLF